MFTVERNHKKQTEYVLFYRSWKERPGVVGTRKVFGTPEEARDFIISLNDEFHIYSTNFKWSRHILLTEVLS